MFKQALFIVALVGLGLVAMPTSATTADFTVNGIPGTFIYPSTWDNLVLDFNLPNRRSSGDDSLLALTVQSNGTARGGVEITALHLWRDAGAAGWQGWGTDQEVAIATVADSVWTFTNLSVPIGTAGQRMFLTADAASVVSTQRTWQPYIPAFKDSNGNGAFDSGDGGIFLAYNSGAGNEQLANTSIHIVKETRYDLWAPQATFTSHVAGQTIIGTSATLSGQARDQGINGTVALVKVGIAPVGQPAVWYSATGSGTGAINWQYLWTNITPGQYVIQLQAVDGVNNTSAISSGVTVTVAADTNTPPAEVPQTLRDGSLVKTATGSQVYAISDGKRRWITSGAVFEELGYKWSNIVAVTQTALNQYPEGDAISITYRHPNGTLLKYFTYPEVYRLDAGARRHVANETVFLGLGYQWGQIVTVPDWEQYPDGTEIK